MRREVGTRQKADVLRLRVEKGKLTREWEHRGDRIAKLDHESTKLQSLGRGVWKSRRGTVGSGDQGTDFLIHDGPLSETEVLSVVRDLKASNPTDLCLHLVRGLLESL